MRFFIFMMVAALMTTACGKKGTVPTIPVAGGGNPGDPPAPAGVTPPPPGDPYVLAGEMYYESRAEYDLALKSYDSNKNCVRLFKNNAGSRYLESRSGTCTTPGALQFYLGLTATEITYDGIKVGQYQVDDEGQYAIYDLCTGTYAARCTTKVQANILKCVTTRSDGQCE